MIYFIGIHHKPGLPALCSSTRSGKKINQVIAGLINCNCQKINLFSTTHLPKKNSVEFLVEINKFRGAVPDAGVLVLLGKAVQQYFPYEDYPRAEIVKFRHPAFSGSDYSKNLVVAIEKVMEG